MERVLQLLGFSAGRIVFGNPLGDWAYALSLGLLTFAALVLVRQRLIQPARRYAGSSLPFGVRLLATLFGKTRVYLLLALSLLAGFKYLDLGARAERFSTAVIVTMLALQLGLWLTAAVRFYLEAESATSSDRNSQTMVTILQFVASLAIWSLVALLALDNLGFQVRALLAGLGIGGIALALAVQNVLGDLLASLSIAFDKPFEIGDALTLDNGYSGSVEAIGIKSTRLRGVGGEQIVIANAELIRTRIRNYGRLIERRASLRLPVAHGTPPEQLRAIPELVRTAVAAAPATRFERAHFATIGLGALEFEASYVVMTADYARYMDAQQAVNLALLTALADRGIRLAPPPLAAAVAAS